MKSDNPLKHFAIAFVVAALGYAFFYYGIEHRRNQKGPWEVIFTNTAAGTPLLIVNQPTIGVTNAQIAFEGEHLPAAAPASPQAASSTNPPTDTLVPVLIDPAATSAVQRYSQPHPVPFAVPFGKCVFMDTTFLPGTVTFELFGHEIELLPRVLTIDYQEHSWRSGGIISLARSNAPASRRQ